MKLSIITINYNNSIGFQKTMESVLRQTSHDFEYIVVDGTRSPKVGENVRSHPSPLREDSAEQKVLRSFVLEESDYTDGFFRCSWRSLRDGKSVGGGYYSEPDTGIYNAMNKGIRMAKGDYIHFLNSGDWLVDEQVVERMLDEVTNYQLGVLSSDSKEPLDILVGNVISIRPDGKMRHKAFNNTPVSLYTFYRGTIEHTSAYIRRDLFDTYGLYDESLKIVSDWKWYLQVAGLHKANVRFANIYVSYFDTSGISSTNLQLDREERRKVLEELIPAPILSDYDRYSFSIDQMLRLKKYKLIYSLVFLAERILFKIDKWNLKYFSWKRH